MKGGPERHVLIGLRVKVKKHWDPSLEQAEGIIVWDYARALLIRTDDGKEKLVLKDGAIFLLFADDGKIYEVDGRKLIRRPQSRARQG